MQPTASFVRKTNKDSKRNKLKLIIREFACSANTG